ncbi:MAG TPA: cytochrome c biogenesis protein CcsA [Thermoanaerobaculia bacterium]|jgi:heme exporter protein C|nr:cytochrome c biogenesis protein CcsA [Thermoanaerobaculia bacterium]
MMKTLLAWLLWLWIAAVILGAFFYAPLAAGFLGESSRILFFHVPMAWVSFVAFIAAGIWSVRYLFGGRHPRHDRAAAAAIEIGLVFGVLATVSGSLWARVMWNAYWNWDPRQTSIVIVLTFYGAYLILRSAIEDADTRGRLSAAYAALGLVVAPFLFFIVPRIMFSLHPESVINAEGKIDMESRMRQVLFAGAAGFTALFFWMHNLRCRVQALVERKSAPIE